MTLRLRTKARLFDLHCTVGLTDWDMDKELRLAATTDQLYHGDSDRLAHRPGQLECVFMCFSLTTDDKLSDQYMVQRPSARASRRKDEFIWYDKTSGERTDLLVRLCSGSVSLLDASVLQTPL